MIEPASAADATEPQIAYDTSGNAVVVWQRLHGMRNNIWSNRYTVGSGWSTAAVIETDDTGAESLPQIAIDPHGNALGVWQQTAGAQISFWWNWFESDHP
jgi:subtilase family serine protease